MSKEDQNQPIKNKKPGRPSRKCRQEQDAQLRDSIQQVGIWRYDQICAESPVNLSKTPGPHWRRVLEMFQPDDIVWIGKVDESGDPEHAANFKTVKAWLAATEMPGPYICASTFMPGCVSRCKENIAARRFLVMGSGTLEKDLVGFIYFGLIHQFSLRLRAIVDDGNGALQAWFDYPDAEVEQKLKAKLIEIGCGLRLVQPSQPVCLPSGEQQRLIYLQAQRD